MDYKTKPLLLVIIINTVDSQIPLFPPMMAPMMAPMIPVMPVMPAPIAAHIAPRETTPQPGQSGNAIQLNPIQIIIPQWDQLMQSTTTTQAPVTVSPIALPPILVFSIQGGVGPVGNQPQEQKRCCCC